MRTTNAEGDPDEKVVYHNDLYVVTKRISRRGDGGSRGRQAAPSLEMG